MDLILFAYETMSYALLLLATLLKENYRNRKIRKERINERMSVSSYVVSFVINDDIEPTAGVHKLLSLLFFSGSLIILRSINDAIGSLRKEKISIIVFFVVVVV